MAYTREQINRISADKRAVRNLVYLDTDGNSWKGLDDGRLIKTFTSDKVVSVKHEPGQIPESLREYLDALNLTTLSIIQNNATQVEIDFGDTTPIQTVIVHINDIYVKTTSKIIPSVMVSTGKDGDELEFNQFTCSVYNIVENVGYDVSITDGAMQAEGTYLLNLIRI